MFFLRYLNWFDFLLTSKRLLGHGLHLSVIKCERMILSYLNQNLIHAASYLDDV